MYVWRDILSPGTNPPLWRRVCNERKDRQSSRSRYLTVNLISPLLKKRNPVSFDCVDWIALLALGMRLRSKVGTTVNTWNVHHYRGIDMDELGLSNRRIEDTKKRINRYIYPLWWWRRITCLVVWSNFHGRSIFALQKYRMYPWVPSNEGAQFTGRRNLNGSVTIQYLILAIKNEMLMDAEWKVRTWKGIYVSRQG